MSTEELKPCPFCGQPERAQHLPTCWFLLRDIGASRARLAEAWNRRAAPAARDQSGVKTPETRMDAAFEGGPSSTNGGAANSNSPEFDGIRSAAPAAGTEKDALAALNDLAEEAHANGNDWDGCIIPLVNRVRAAIEAGTEKDTARLDFMIAEQCLIQHMDRIGAASVYRVYWPWRRARQHEWSATPREAIDAAIAAKEPPCSS